MEDVRMAQTDLCIHDVAVGRCGSCEAANYRREMYGGVVEAIEAAKWIPKITDTDLRAECERRGMRVGDHLGSRIESQRALIAERDEWKRRAEAAEAKTPVRVTGWTITAEATWERHGQRVEFKDRDCVTSIPIRLLLVAASAYAPIGRESGPGIAATRPDNSIAHLDEDLLCDDA